MNSKGYCCPKCGTGDAPQIVRTYPPKMMKCQGCGFVGEESRFLRAPASH